MILRFFPLMEHMGFEPTTSTMQMWRAPNCANAPDRRFICGKNGSNGARTHDLSRVRRTLIPAELCFQGGDRGTRTPDLYVANVSLSQLSYIPVNISGILEPVHVLNEIIIAYTRRRMQVHISFCSSFFLFHIKHNFSFVDNSSFSVLYCQEKKRGTPARK